MICLGKKNQLDFTFKEILHSFQMNNPFSNNDTGWIKLQTKLFHRTKLILYIAKSKPLFEHSLNYLNLKIKEERNVSKIAKSI